MLLGINSRLWIIIACLSIAASLDTNSGKEIKELPPLDAKVWKEPCFRVLGPLKLILVSLFVQIASSSKYILLPAVLSQDCTLVISPFV